MQKYVYPRERKSRGVGFSSHAMRWHCCLVSNSGAAELERLLQGFGRNPTFSPKDKVYFMTKAITFFTDAPPKAAELEAKVEAARAAAWAHAETMETP